MFIRALLMSTVFAADDGGAGAGAAAGTAAAGAGAGAAPGAGAPGAAGAGAGGAAGTGAAATPPAFAETLPEDIRGDAVFRDIKDLPGLAKSYKHATSMIGGRPEDLLRVPGPDDAAAWDGVYGKLGRPEKADGYTFTGKPPEGITVDETLQTAFKTVAHKAGLNSRQANALHDWWNSAAGEARTAAIAADTARHDGAIATLKTEWGAAFDTKLATAKAGLQHYGGAELAAFLEESRLGNDPRMLRAFEKLGAQLAEDGVIGRGAGQPAILSPAEADQQINALHADKDFQAAYTNAKAPGHADAVAKMQRLFQMKHPPKAA